MFIAYFKTKSNMIAREADTFSEAWGILRRLAEGRNDIVKAVVLKEDAENYLDDQCPDFDSLEVVASMRTIQ